LFGPLVRECCVFALIEPIFNLGYRIFDRAARSINSCKWVKKVGRGQSLAAGYVATISRISQPIRWLKTQVSGSGLSGLYVDRLVEANASDQLSFAVDDLDPVVTDQAALAHRLCGKRSRAGDCIIDRCIEIGEFLALLVARFDVVMDVEKIFRHRRRYD
jgi:hypothetical protein